MNENEQYVANAIRLWVWSGLHSLIEAKENIYDIIADGDDESMLLSLVDTEFQRKIKAEQTWPAVTDYEKLDDAFRRIRSCGVVAIHNAGWDKSEGFHECLERYRAAGSPEDMFGLCYYITQDVDHAIDQEFIYLGVGATRLETEQADAARASQLVCSHLHDVGLETEWNGDTKTRIKVNMKWQKRSAPSIQHQKDPAPNPDSGPVISFLKKLVGRR